MRSDRDNSPSWTDIYQRSRRHNLTNYHHILLTICLLRKSSAQGLSTNSRPALLWNRIINWGLQQRSFRLKHQDTTGRTAKVVKHHFVEFNVGCLLKINVLPWWELWCCQKVILYSLSRYPGKNFNLCQRLVLVCHHARSSPPFLLYIKLSFPITFGWFWGCTI